ncbi:hypothetical protein, partial [Hungatella hathewayi]
VMVLLWTELRKLERIGSLQNKLKYYIIKKKIHERRMFPMKYTKPVVLKKKVVNGAVCGNGSPCGRPCSKRA